MHLGIEIT